MPGAPFGGYTWLGQARVLHEFWFWTGGFGPPQGRGIPQNQKFSPVQSGSVNISYLSVLLRGEGVPENEIHGLFLTPKRFPHFALRISFFVWADPTPRRVYRLEEKEVPSPPPPALHQTTGPGWTAPDHPTPQLKGWSGPTLGAT